jgi:Helix-turn-helix domain
MSWICPPCFEAQELGAPPGGAPALAREDAAALEEVWRREHGAPAADARCTSCGALPSLGLQLVALARALWVRPDRAAHRNAARKELLGLRDAARALGLSRERLTEYIRKGAVRAVRVGGRGGQPRLRVSVEEIDRIKREGLAALSEARPLMDEPPSSPRLRARDRKRGGTTRDPLENWTAPPKH